ncbi:Pr6Pr family membrane protein [Litorisediminicola beolgyonensis]|uniref:Pr6Pr family membrane protein n=1 Tax=Litorisediminicola beolgyonensis TaxID=1173614 RepID=A0ABW3ZJ05_9RHOB
MVTRHRFAALLVALIALGALALQLHVGLDRRPGRAALEELWRMGRYFTNLTALLVGLSLLIEAAGRRLPATWIGGLVLWEIVVALVYHGLLARDLAGLRAVADQLLHSAVPAVVALYWLAIRHVRLDWRAALLWLGWPALYLLYAIGRGLAGDRYPYFFLDPVRQGGWDGVALWILGLGTAIWLLGIGLIALSRLSPDRPRSGNGVPADPRPR